MKRIKITRRVIEGLKATGEEYFVWDSERPGLGVRVSPNGIGTYIYRFRVGSGRGAASKRIKIGPVDAYSPEQARKKADGFAGAVSDGRDPANERAEERQALTVKELGALFLADHVRVKRKASTAELYEYLVAKIEQGLGSKKAAKLTNAEVARFHRDLKDHPYAANRALAVLSSMLSWAARFGYVPNGHNPAAKVEHFEERARERYLSPDELDRLGAALREAETVGIPYQVDPSKPKAKHAAKAENRRTKFDAKTTAAIRLLLFTGARLREILHLRWDYFDEGRGLLFLPDSKTGRKTIVLSAPALAVLSSLSRDAEYVFWADDPSKPRHDLKKPWATITARAGLDGLRIHDLRHTFASYGAGSSLGLPVIGKLLGHTQAATTQRYAHLDADPLRKAADRIGSTIAGAMGEGPRTDGAEIVPLGERRAAGGRA